MKELKNIDRLYQEKFRDFETEPPEHIWKNIEARLHGKKEQSRALWLWMSGVAAGLMLLFTLTNNLIFNPVDDPTPTANPDNYNTNTEEIISSQENNSKPNTIEKTILSQESPEAKQSTSNKLKPLKSNSKSTPTNQLIATTYQQTKANSTNHFTDKPNQVLKPKQKTIYPHTKNVQIAESKISNFDIIQTYFQHDFKQFENFEELADNTSLDDTEHKNISKPWTVSTSVAPVYFNAFDKASSINSQFNLNDKEGLYSASYAVQIAYQINNKWAIQTGLHKTDYGYKTNDVYFSPDPNEGVYASLIFDDNIDLLEISPRPDDDVNLEYQETGRKSNEIGSITQIMGYYEIPLEAKYNLISGNFGINLTGGVSTLLLNKNEVYIETPNFSNKVGKVSNLNNTSFSGNLGLELNYKIHPDISVNIAPAFKVYTHTFKKNTDSFNPYVLGIYSGLNYRF